MGVCGGGGEPWADRAAEEAGRAEGRGEEARAALLDPGRAPLSPRGGPRCSRQRNGSSRRRPASHAAPYAQPRRGLHSLATAGQPRAGPPHRRGSPSPNSSPQGAACDLTLLLLTWSLAAPSPDMAC